jgi:relaxase-like protein/conjugative element/phage-associated large polyvalent protein/DNA relaxase TraI-like protein
MIVKVQPSRKHSSSFKRLHEYLTQERDAETGELVLRGDVVLSWNLLSFDTAAGEMQGVASLNDRCKDAVCHYELSWPPGERPTRPQWTDSAVQTLKALGYEHHQYMVVAHDDKKHFHIHIMVNKVHPQTLRAPTPYRNWLALDAAARRLEAKYGWAHTPGMTRWDEESKQAVPISRSERIALRSAREQPTEAAAKLEHYHDEESLQTYVRKEVAPRVRQLLIRRNVTWDDLHLLLSKAHLRLEKGESGGYTVLAIDYNIRVKASDVFRDSFAGKINRQNTEAALGTWTPASTSGYEDAQHGAEHAAQHNPRNSALREERKAQRHAARIALVADYNQYRNRRREVCKALTTDCRESRQYHLDVLRQQKREIRASALPWPDKKVLLSQATAQSVLEIRALKLAIQQRRQEAFPKNLRSWVADRADGGDARAAAQLRGWRYADQRNQRRLDARLEASALHIGPPPEDNQKSDWADFVQQRLSAHQSEQNLAKRIATTRIWTINRKTGDVSYMLNGRVSVIDRGRLVTVLSQDEAAIVFGLEMAVQKYGSRIACTGSDEWKRMVAMCAIKHGIFAQFTDPEMQGAFYQEQLLANPLQLRAVRLHSIETRLRTEETEDLIFADETDARLLLSSLQPVAQSRQLLEILKASQQPEPKENVGGNLTIALVRSSTGQQAFKVSIHEGRRQEIIERVVQLRQTAYRASRNNSRMLSNERDGR